MFVVNYKRTLIDQVELEALYKCPKCGSDKWLLNTTETRMSVLFGSTTAVKAGVFCAGCSKRIAGKRLSTEIIQLIRDKDNHFKPSFTKRFGFIIVLVALFVGIISYATISTVSDHNKVVKDASENFTKAYGEQAQKAWLENIQTGDFLLCSKNYNDPAIVFEVKEVTQDSVVMLRFDQTVDRSDFDDLSKLNQLTLGTGNSIDVSVSRKYFLRNIIELDGDSRNNLSVQQIKKTKSL